MALADDLFPWIKTQAAVVALLGGAERPRWFYGTAPPQSARPYVVWRIGAPQSDHHQGGRSGLGVEALIVDVYGSDDAAPVRALVTAIDVALDGFRGAMGRSNVRRVRRERITDLPELRGDGSARATLRTQLEFTAWLV